MGQTTGTWDLRDIDGCATTATEMIREAWEAWPDAIRTTATWAAYCDGRLYRAQVVRFPAPIRGRIVASLTEAGMSTRAVAIALQVSDQTVRADQKRAGLSTPASVTGMDGRRYAPARELEPDAEDSDTSASRSVDA